MIFTKYDNRLMKHSSPLTFLQFTFLPPVPPAQFPPEVRPRRVWLEGDLLANITVDVITEAQRLYALLAALRLSQPLSEGVHGGGGRVAGGGHHVLLPGQEVDPGGPLLPQHLH